MICKTVCWVKEVRHKSMHTPGFHLYRVQKLAKLIYWEVRIVAWLLGMGGSDWEEGLELCSLIWMLALWVLHFVKSWTVHFAFAHVSELTPSSLTLSFFSAMCETVTVSSQDRFLVLAWWYSHHRHLLNCALQRRAVRRVTLTRGPRPHHCLQAKDLATRMLTSECGRAANSSA